MKKTTGLLAAAAMLLVFATPAFAGRHHHHNRSDDLTIRNKAKIGNLVLTGSNSGANHIGGMFVGKAKIKTGDAYAGASLLNDVNYNDVDCDGCRGDVKIRNRAKVGNIVVTGSNSGMNHIGGMVVCGARIRTGASTAESAVTNLVNTTIVGGGGEVE
ncbi:hypothetical protein ACFL2C_00545 [Patescibacteria group bacterium]